MEEDDLEGVLPPFRELDYRQQILDEICLEGLDGATLQALWLRLRERPLFLLGVEGASKEFIWEIIRNMQEVQIFKLKAPRNDLVIHDRYKYVDGELGIVVEPEALPEDIYPFHLVEDTAGGVRGSCQSYNSRTLICEEVDLKAAESLGGRLVLVGSQEARNRSILGNQFDPLQFQNITPMQWALLERIGRSRFHGEITQGNLSLQFTHENPKTLFYHRKALLAKGMLTKQVHHQKTVKQLKNLKTRSQNSQGTLFHLPRFYVERKPKTMVLVRSVIDLLRRKRTGIATYDELRNHLNLGNAFKKLFKTQEFQRFMRGDVKVPYRTVYPDATAFEWRRKGMMEEKMVRVVELMDRGIKPEDVSLLDQQELSLDVLDEDEDGEEEEEEATRPRETTFGVLDQSGWLLDRSMMWQAYGFVEEAGPEGISQQDLGRKLGQGKLEARTICRNLLRRGLVITIMNDKGRQRVTNFVAKRLEHISPSSNQFLMEKKKNEQLLAAPLTEELHEDGLNVTGIKILNRKGKRVEDIEDEVEDEEEEEDVERMARGRTDRGRSKVREEDEDRRRTESLLDQSESNSCDSSIFMSIRSDFQLEENSRSPLKRKKDRRSESQSTFRQLRRANTIIEAVRQYKVIDDPTKLYKMIQENEIREGYNAKMDKKSLMRILSKLGKDGQIKNITVQLQLEDKTKSLHFVCDPGIDETNTVIQSAIEQAKMKFNSCRYSPPPPSEDLEQGSEDERWTKEDTPLSPGLSRGSAAARPPAGKSTRKYGLQPKFVRMRELHILLYYLSRNYTGIPSLDQDKTLKSLAERELIESSEIRELQNVKLFSTDVSWKMFIPPLPFHEGWSTGWCLMCDVLLRLPLSVFVKLVHVTLEIPGLQKYLSHPVKQHLLIRNLPQTIRNKLLHRRKYIFTVHEVSCRLAYIGVIQFGPQKLKEKDQVFIYVNTSASLLDTTQSRAGYHQIEPGREYPLKSYKLDSLVNVEHYWYDMWEICVNTPLGEVSSLSGQEITLEVMDKKPEMIAALSPRQAEDAPLQDLGRIPGDGLGAAGLDSSIFAHLKRNWSWNARTRRGDKAEKLTKPPFCIRLLQEERDELDEDKILSLPETPTPTITMEPNRAKENRKRKKSCEGASQSNSKVLIKEQSGRPIKYVRVIGKRRTAVERKPYYDEKDKAALRLMRKLRVDWSPREDSFLLLCKAVGTFLCTNSRTQMVQYTSVRDKLHTYFPESCNKTSRACQRRLNYMMKNGTTADSVALFLADLEQDEELMGKFARTGPVSETRAEAEARLEQQFSELVDSLISKNRDSSIQKPSLNLPDTKEEVLKKFSILYPSDSAGSKLGFSEPKEVSDIHMCVVNTLVTSSLCTASDRRSWTFQLFKIYQQYPDQLLRKVMSNLRENKMVSLKKQYNKNKVKQGNYLPLSSSPYQLSVTFSHTFLNRYQYDIYTQSWQQLKALLANPHAFADIVVGQEGGYAAAVVSLLASDRLLFRTEVPEQLVVLDPGLSAVDENYVRILERYKELLRNAGGLDTNDADYVKLPSKLTSTALFTKRKDMEGTIASTEDINMEDVAEKSGGKKDSKFTREKRKVKKRVNYENEDESTLKRLEKLDFSDDKPAEGTEEQSAVSTADLAAMDSTDQVSKETTEQNTVSKSVKKAHEKADGVAGVKVLDKEALKDRLESRDGRRLHNEIVFQEGKDTRSNATLAKSASRIALYMMREEMRDNPLESGDPVQHSHDFFVISSCTVQGRLLTRGAEDGLVSYTSGLQGPAALLPGDVSVYSNILRRYGINLNGTPIPHAGLSDKEAYVPLELDSEQIFEEMRADDGHSQADLDSCKSIWKAIDEQREMGMGKEQLRSLPYLAREDITRSLMVLLQKRLVLEVGVLESRFVSHSFSRDWLIHTYKLNRVRDLEKMHKPKYAGKLYQGHGPREDSFAKAEAEAEPEAGGERRRSRRTLRKNSLDDAVGGEDIIVDHRLKNPQCAARTSREVVEAAGKINWDEMEEVLINIKPWIRVDGSLNRRVLDRLLGAVLGAVMQQPGSTLSSLTSRFSPALQPTHARELLFLLKEMGAATVSRMVKPPPPGLWSRPQPARLETPDILDLDHELVVEGSVDAVLRLGQFIGEKLYSQDFVCHCPCHPERRM